MTQTHGIPQAFGIDADAALAGLFSTKGENLVILAEDTHSVDRIGHHILHRCSDLGLSTGIVWGTGFFCKANLADEGAAMSPKVVLVDLPKSSQDNNFGPLSSGESVALLLKKRAQLRRSTILLANRTPTEWRRQKLLGPDTAKAAAAAGIGVILDKEDRHFDAYLSHTRFKSWAAAELYRATGVASLDSIHEAIKTEIFGIVGAPPVWHWLLLDASSAWPN